MTEEKIAPEENTEETPAVPAGESAAAENAEPKTDNPPEEAAPTDEPEAAPEKAEETAPEPEAPAEAPAEAAPEEAAEEEPEEEGKKKKIRHLSLEEVEKKLNRARSKMGGEASVYVRHLKARKKELSGGGK